MQEKRKKKLFTNRSIGFYKKQKIGNLLVVLFGLPFLLIGQTLQKFEYAQPKMGTEFRLVFYTTDSIKANKAAEIAFQRIDALNQIFSDYEASSELSRLSLSAGSGQKVQVSKELWEVLSMAQSISKKSKGAFDATIGPLTKIWRRAIRQNQFPDKMVLAAAKEKVCYKHLKLHPSTRSVSLTKEGMRLDLGGIAKGYTVDEVYKTLKEQGITRALIDGGGDIYAGMPPPDSGAWKVIYISKRTRTLSLDFFDPQSKTWTKRQENKKVVYLSNAAIASSGNTYKSLEIDGTKYSHIINPKTGLGLTHNDILNVQSLTCALADALASTVSVLSPKKGNRFLKKYIDTKLSEGVY